MKRNPWRVLAAALIVTAGLTFVVSFEILVMSDKRATERDFIQYWAAGQQLTHGANPYDVPSILRLEQKAGFEGNEPRVSLSPPTVFFFVLPLGIVSPKTGLILWSFVLLGCLSLSVRIIWLLNGRPDDGFHLIGIGVRACAHVLDGGTDQHLSFTWHRAFYIPPRIPACPCRSGSVTLRFKTAPIPPLCPDSVSLGG